MRNVTLVYLLTAALLVGGCARQSAPVVTPPAPTPGGAVTAPAPEPEPVVHGPAIPDPMPVARTIPNPVRGIHVSGWYAGSPDLIGPLLTWAHSAGINTVILDIKAEDGKLSWESDVPMAKEIGANARKIGDLKKTVADMHARGFWVAGRIVVMNDAYLYRARPAWTIPGFPGGAYSFMDPKNEQVWRYNLEVAKSAVAAGVDEIQFDYIRYPEKLVNGYNRDTGADYRTGAINGFLKMAVDELKPGGTVVSADIFGLTTSVAEGDDMQIGQDYRSIAQIVDYVSAMVYPSHYAPGTYGVANPDASPYDTVNRSMAKALERSTGIPVEKHRPWIQDFTYPAPGALRYAQAELAAQVKALTDLGIKSFLLWDPSNKYTRGVDYAKLSP